MKFLLIGSGLIILWAIGMFVVNIATGWVHLPLAVGSVLIAMGIVASGENGDKESREQEAGRGERGAGSGT